MKKYAHLSCGPVKLSKMDSELIDECKTYCGCYAPNTPIEERKMGEEGYEKFCIELVCGCYNSEFLM